MAVDGDETDAEMRRIGPQQLGNVVGDSARIVRPELLVAIAQEAPQRCLDGISGRSGRAVCTGRTNVHDLTPCFAQNASNWRAMYTGWRRVTVTPGRCPWGSGRRRAG